MSICLMVVDMQIGFLNDNTKHIVPNVRRLVEAARTQSTKIVFTRFVNRPESGYVKWIRWSRFMERPEIDLIPQLAPYAKNVFDKHGYTAFTDDVARFLTEHSIDRIVICGVATDGCVLKTAVDAFERHIEPIVVHDACASHAGESLHEAGKLLLGRFIGKGQLQTVEQVLQLVEFTAG